MSIDDNTQDDKEVYVLEETLKRTLRAFAYNYRYAENGLIRESAERHALRFIEDLSEGMDSELRQEFTKAYLLYFNKAKNGNDQEYPRPEDEIPKS